MKHLLLLFHRCDCICADILKYKILELLYRELITLQYQTSNKTNKKITKALKSVPTSTVPMKILPLVPTLLFS